METKGEEVVVAGEHDSTLKDAASHDFARGVYPVELECVLSSRSHETLRVRPIRPDDDKKLAAFHSKLSADSIYRRYFSVHPELSPGELVHLTQVDYVDRLALVIETGDRLIAVCRYERYPGTTDAEVAFIVADDHQHQGLGQLMLHRLAEAAWERGISTFLAETLATNREMMSVFLSSGYPMSTTSENHEIVVRLSIEPTDDTRRERVARPLVGDPEPPC